MLSRLLTIGVYGFDRDAFLDALLTAGADAVCDVRARRGVRGAAYAWANAGRLVPALEAAGLAYLHRPDLAPGAATRRAQDAADAREHVARRERDHLSPAFLAGYRRDVLDRLDAAAVLAALSQLGRTPALLCVERVPSACHRSLLAEALAAASGVGVRHIVPSP